VTRVLVVRPPPRPSLLRDLFTSVHEHLIDHIQAGRADAAFELARLLASVGRRL
jgi:hypothetical protein